MIKKSCPNLIVGVGYLISRQGLMCVIFLFEIPCGCRGRIQVLKLVPESGVSACSQFEGRVSSESQY